MSRARAKPCAPANRAAHAGQLRAPRRLWGSLKVGRLYGKRFATQRQAMDEVIDWLTFYNHRRLHSTLAYVSPMQLEQHLHAGQPKQAA